MAEVFNVNEDTIRNLQGLKEDRSNIVRVKGSLQVARPPRSREERERLERQEREQEREDEREQSESRRGGHGRGREEREQERERRESQRGGRGGGGYNGIEETLCTLRLRENIHDPSRADIYNPHAGRISTLNSHNLPVLRWLQLSAEFGRLQRVRALVSILKKKEKKSYYEEKILTSAFRELTNKICIVPNFHRRGRNFE